MFQWNYFNPKLTSFYWVPLHFFNLKMRLSLQETHWIIRIENVFVFQNWYFIVIFCIWTICEVQEEPEQK